MLSKIILIVIFNRISCPQEDLILVFKPLLITEHTKCRGLFYYRENSTINRWAIHYRLPIQQYQYPRCLRTVQRKSSLTSRLVVLPIDFSCHGFE